VSDKLIGISPSDGKLSLNAVAGSSQVAVTATYTFDFLAQQLLPYGPITLAASSQSPY